MKRFNLSLPAAFARKARSIGKKAGAVGTGVLVSGAAMASTPSTDIITAINAGKADAILVAVAVVIALWAIWSVYLMRRKG
jgi:hypothetical protein